MADRPGPIPVRQTTLGTFAWAYYATRRHWLVALATIAVSFVISILDPNVYSIAQLAIPLPLAVLVHNEVIRGHARWDSDSLGRHGGRVFFYLVDLLVLALILVPFVAIPMPLLFFAFEHDQAMALAIASIAITSIIGFVITLRLSLRLPSRAIGNTLTWRQSWYLGRGNTLRMLLVALLTTLPLAVVQVGLDYLSDYNANFLALTTALFTPIGTAIMACYLSLMYIHCLLALDPRRNNPQGGQT